MTDAEKRMLESVADLMMGAAYADGHLAGVELRTVRDLLETLVDEKEQLDALMAHVDKFSPDKFDLKQCCNNVDVGSLKAARTLLTMIARVTDADQIQDLDEGAYLRRVATFLGVAEEDCADLAVEVISVSDLTQPPPLPSDSK